MMSTRDVDEVIVHPPAWRVAYCRGRRIVDWAGDVAAASREEAEAESLVRGICKIAEFDGLQLAMLHSAPPCCSRPSPAPPEWRSPRLREALSAFAFYVYARNYHVDPNARIRILDRSQVVGHTFQAEIACGGIPADSQVWVDPGQPLEPGDIMFARVFEAEMGVELGRVLCDYPEAILCAEECAEDESAWIEPIGRVAWITPSGHAPEEPLWPAVRDHINHILGNAA
jgi:hypothetical protein